ncbi:MAG: hypothetical protein HYY09_01995 [Firmicutes bacterium]|nr:hypothetical protein [Bacillota bacterium]
MGEIRPSSKLGKQWWRFWAPAPPPLDQCDAGAAEAVKPVSPADPEQRDWLRQEFISYTGQEEFDRFVTAVIKDARPKGRLMFWQESLLTRFAQKYRIFFSIDLENVNRIFEADLNMSSRVFTDYAKRFYASLFPEEGPATCSSEGCGRKTVKYSVLCAKHHYEMIERASCPWDGPPQLTDEERDFLKREKIERKSDGDFYGACREKKYEELPESRSWDSDPVFRNILDPLNSGDYQKASYEAQAILPRFADFAEIYYWWSRALINKGSNDEARQVLIDGLSKANQKHLLLEILGEIEWKSGSLKDAVRWWAQAILCQESLESFGKREGPYLYLHCIAQALGLEQVSSALLSRVDFIRPGRVRLSPEVERSLKSSVQELVDLWYSSDDVLIERGLQTLANRYLDVTTAAPLESSESDELTGLIRIVQDSTAAYDLRGEAIRKLGEIGDHRAIEPLMNVYKTELHLIRLDALDAAEKIRGRNT